MLETKQLTLKAFENMLKQHDWYYMMSEDPSKYKAGCYQRSNLKDLSETTNEHKELFKIYENKHKIN